MLQCWICLNSIYNKTLSPLFVSDSRIKKAPLWLLGCMSSSTALYLLMPVNSHLSRQKTHWGNETMLSYRQKLVSKFGKSSGTISEHIPHWRRTETTRGSRWCHVTEENTSLVPNLHLHLHRDSSCTRQGTPHLSFHFCTTPLLSHTHARTEMRQMF